MKSLRYWIKTAMAVACGALVLGLVANDGQASKKPQPSSLFWPDGGQVLAHYVPPPSLAYLSVGWTPSNLADHYRVTVVVKNKYGSTVCKDVSPATYQINSDGLACVMFTGPLPGADAGIRLNISIKVTVTAYSEPDEAVAYSESLQTQITMR